MHRPDERQLLGRLLFGLLNPPLDFPDVQHVTLSNGVKFNYAQRTTVPVTQIALGFDAGYSADAPTGRGLQGMTLALLDEGADGLECDVRLTRDGVLRPDGRRGPERGPPRRPVRAGRDAQVRRARRGPPGRRPLHRQQVRLGDRLRALEARPPVADR